MFKAITRTHIPAQWNTTRITPVHKKGSMLSAANYRPVSVMGPLAKLFSTCMNMRLEAEAYSKAWRAPTQAGFRKHHRLEDLVIMVDYAIARAQV